ncbi:MAG TPA: ferredoxin [Verrucomicrobiae bacterium]|nr:ferredoxin [Verrucomicrobiae bacterium]
MYLLRVVCDQTAPSIFRECNEKGWAYVFKQPQTVEELRQCMEAVGGCPTQSIGKDGDASPDLSLGSIFSN